MSLLGYKRESALCGRFSAERLFYRLSPITKRELTKITTIAILPNRSVVFTKGQPSKYIYILKTGLATEVSFADNYSCDLIFPGEILGLPEAIAAAPYSSTIRTIAVTKLQCIEREAFFNFLNTNNDIGIRLIHLLSEDLVRNLHE